MNAVSSPVERAGSPPTVLVVDDDRTTRDRYGEWLETAGYSVSNCPGPSLSERACLGMRGVPCPLSHAADIVLLDSRRLSGLSHRAKPGWLLLRHYLKAGKPIVVIAERYRPDHTFRPEQVAVLHSEPGRESILLAVRRMLNKSRRW